MERSLRKFLFLITKEETNCVPGGHGDFSERVGRLLKAALSKDGVNVLRGVSIM